MHSGPAKLIGEPLKNTILKSHGRPPWYDENGKHISDAFVIGIAGTSGKTHVARQILRSLGCIPSVVIMSQDSFYKELTSEQLELAFANQYDFDHPDAIDMTEFASCLSDLKKGRQTNMPVYSFAKHQRLKERTYLYGASIIITEGIMTLHDPVLRSLYDLKIFVKCDSDLMLARRIKRDINERGRNIEGILSQYLRFVKPAYDDFVFPTSRYADIIVPGLDNSVAIDLITTHIRRQLDDRSRGFRESIARPRPGQNGRPRSVSSSSTESIASLESLNVHVIEQTPQIKGIYTILRDKDTSREDFIFFTDRLSMFLAEQAISFLPFRAKTVITPTGVQSHGKELDATSLCGVSILRSGGPLEKGLRRVINGIRIGSLLVQSDQNTGEPLLLHVMLPACIRDRALARDSYVLLLDAQIGTGAAGFMAIRTLLDHGVQPDHIVFVTFLIARNGGVAALHRAFPEVRIICGAVDDVLSERWVEASQVHEGEGDGSGESDERRIWAIEPGMGQIGDRYYL
ncbi:armadillo/beta-catenin/plakoglobin [Fomitiporia mediterranea MF3/22]|uniref:armadillo/beta-catenin/plakoglobin n=1 Tax=Fomitiporia mediterranea (strain MF3/22) TaxID=694068 RepID=UPI0004408458|nr:armadillo/beta-catenin/plakoglobin [Fomitiporia mediterranea MF3/22]EJD06974.1 armadillo/beta-catenin/plakoglobin [Fomitiporia mediterranea MF3/22]